MRCEGSGSSLVRFSYETFAAQRADYPGHDSFLRLELSPMRFVYFNLLWMELMHYKGRTLLCTQLPRLPPPDGAPALASICRMQMRQE